MADSLASNTAFSWQKYGACLLSVGVAALRAALCSPPGQNKLSDRDRDRVAIRTRLTDDQGRKGEHHSIIIPKMTLGLEVPTRSRFRHPSRRHIRRWSMKNRPSSLQYIRVPSDLLSEILVEIHLPVPTITSPGSEDRVESAACCCKPATITSRTFRPRPLSRQPGHTEKLKDQRQGKHLECS